MYSFTEIIYAYLFISVVFSIAENVDSAINYTVSGIKGATIFLPY